MLKLLILGPFYLLGLAFAVTVYLATLAFDLLCGAASFLCRLVTGRRRS